MSVLSPLRTFFFQDLIATGENLLAQIPHKDGEDRNPFRSNRPPVAPIVYLCARNVNGIAQNTCENIELCKTVRTLNQGQQVVSDHLLFEVPLPCLTCSARPGGN
jgi:hypothetical protein